MIEFSAILNFSLELPKANYLYTKENGNASDNTQRGSPNFRKYTINLLEKIYNFLFITPDSNQTQRESTMKLCNKIGN